MMPYSGISKQKLDFSGKDHSILRHHFLSVLNKKWSGPNFDTFFPGIFLYLCLKGETPSIFLHITQGLPARPLAKWYPQI